MEVLSKSSFPSVIPKRLSVLKCSSTRCSIFRSFERFSYPESTHFRSNGTSTTQNKTNNSTTGTTEPFTNHSTKRTTTSTKTVLKPLHALTLVSISISTRPITFYILNCLFLVISIFFLYVQHDQSTRNTWAQRERMPGNQFVKANQRQQKSRNPK